MMEDIILDSYSLCSLNHYKIPVMFFFLFFFYHNTTEIPTSIGMGHAPEVLEKILE